MPEDQDEIGSAELRRWLIGIEGQLGTINRRLENLPFVRDDSWQIEKQLLMAMITANKTYIETESASLRTEVKTVKTELSGTQDSLRKIAFGLFAIFASAVVTLIFAAIPR